MSDTNRSAIVVGPAVVIGPNGAIEAVVSGGVIGNLTGREAAETLQDLAASVLSFDPITGAALEPAADE